MKKMIILFIIILLIVAGIFYMYTNYKANVRQAKFENLKFEKYKDQEVQGIDLATIINTAVDLNEKNRSAKRWTKKLYR